MKILFLTPYPPTKGGLSIFAKKTVDSLISLGVEVGVCRYSGYSTFKMFNNMVKSVKPDAIRIEYNFSTYGIFTIPLFAFVKLLQKKYNYLVFINFHEASREAEMLGIFGKYINVFVSSIADKISVHTEEARKSLIEKCGVYENKIEVIPLGTLPINLNATDFDLLKTKYGIRTEQYVLSIGFIHIHKGIEYLIEAYVKFKQQMGEKNIQLVISGGVRSRKGIFKIFEKKDRDYLMRLKNMVKNLNLEKDVIFTGFTPNNDFDGLITHASVVVLPYTKTEQSGVLNQVLPYNVPIIASNIGGLGETLQNVGILVNPKSTEEIYNELLKITDNVKLRKELLIKYTELNSELKSEAIAKIILKLMQKVIGHE